MAEQGFLFAEMQLQPGDVIDCKGKRLFFRDIYNGMQFVQDHSGIMIVCQIKRIGEQIVYSDGSSEMNYTRPEYIGYEGKGFESCLFFAIPESFKKLEKWE